MASAMSKFSWKGDRKTIENRLEIIATVLLAVATVMSAWSVYEAGRWHGVQSMDQASASALRTESVRASNIAATQAIYDINQFNMWLDAMGRNDTANANIYSERFRPEFQTAFDAWLNTSTVGSLPPGTPFNMPEYQLAEQVESDRLLNEAEAAIEHSKWANQKGDDYVLLTVLFASVLFLSGIQTKVMNIGSKKILLAIALGLLVAATITMLTLPVSVGF